MKRVLDVPLALVSKAVADAFHAKIADYARAEPVQVRYFLLKVALWILIPATAALLPVVIFGPALFAVLFGESWREAGLYASLMVPAAIVNMAVSPVSRVFALTRRLSLRYVFTTVNGLGLTAVFGAAWYWQTLPWVTVPGLSFVSLSAYVAYFLAAWSAAGQLGSEKISDWAD